MKKFYITFTLILSSFFLFNYNVKADTYNYTFNESDFDYLNDIFYKVRDTAIEYSSSNNCYYYIYYTNTYYIIYFNPGSFSDTAITSTSFGIRIYPLTDDFIYIYCYDTGLQSFKLQAKISSYHNLVFRISDNVLLYNSFLDSNYDFYLKNNVINFSYKDRNYIFDSTNSLPSLYEIYSNENSSQEEDIHKQEKEVLSNFYSLIFEKIDLLANLILSNYIYLSIIVIFILIFLIELIRRYLL